MGGYAHVQDGQVVETAQSRDDLPNGYRLSDGASMSGFNTMPDAFLKQEGWLPLEEVTPTHDPATHRVTNEFEYEVLATKVKRVFEVEPIPAPIVEDNTYDLAAQAAEDRLAELATKGWGSLTAAEKGEVAQKAMEAIGLRRKAART